MIAPLTATADPIDHWVATATHGLIPKLLLESSIPPACRAVLVNAMHLSCGWERPFLPHATQPSTFTSFDGAVPCHLMRSSGAVARFAALPVGTATSVPLDGGRFRLVAVVPTARGEAALDALLAPGALGPFRCALREPQPPSSGSPASTARDVLLPRFRLVCGPVSLRDALACPESGAAPIFDPPAAAAAAPPAFEAVGAGVCVSHALHATVVVACEAGLRVAVATAVALAPPPPSPQPPPAPAAPRPDAEPVLPLVCDHPFVVYVEDADSGVVVAVGRVVKPTLDIGSDGLLPPHPPPPNNLPNPHFPSNVFPPPPTNGGFPQQHDIKFGTVQPPPPVFPVATQWPRPQLVGSQQGGQPLVQPPPVYPALLWPPPQPVAHWLQQPPPQPPSSNILPNPHFPSNGGFPPKPNHHGGFPQHPDIKFGPAQPPPVFPTSQWTSPQQPAAQGVPQPPQPPSPGGFNFPQQPKPNPVPFASFVANGVPPQPNPFLAAAANGNFAFRA